MQINFSIEQTGARINILTIRGEREVGRLDDHEIDEEFELARPAGWRASRQKGMRPVGSDLANMSVTRAAVFTPMVVAKGKRMEGS
jgi:hypothetical protein